jgi:outer membrane protein assembly factor BamB
VDSSPVIAGDDVVAASADGRLYVLRLNDGGVRWQYEIGAPIISSPAVVDGRIAVGADDGRIYLFGEAR